MPIQNIFIASALVILVGCQHSLVQDNIPTITRTGEVKDVVIQDTLSPTSIMARPGDEIRWINKRQTDVQVIVIGTVKEQLTCRRNFKEMMGSDHNQYSANVERNDTAGVCFRDPTELRYVVRTESNGESGFLGTVMIVPEDQLPQTASLTTVER